MDAGGSSPSGPTGLERGEGVDPTTERWGETLVQAATEVTYHSRPSVAWPSMDLDTAYAVQAEQIARRVARGETPRAIKLGLVKWAEQEQWGIAVPTFGTLTDSMLLLPGQPFSLARGHAPKVEAEIVFVLGEDVTAPLPTVEDVVAVVERVFAGIEVLDSRYDGGGFNPIDAVADNQSALSGVWSARGLPPQGFDAAGEEVHLLINGDRVAQGSGVVILGDPLIALRDVINDRLARGMSVDRGLAVFSGNLLDRAVPVSAGDRVDVQFSSLGSLQLDVVP